MRCCSVPSFPRWPWWSLFEVMGKVLFHIHHTRWQLRTAYSGATLDLLKYFRGQIAWPKCYNSTELPINVKHWSWQFFPLFTSLCSKADLKRLFLLGFFHICFYSPEHSFISIAIFMAIPCLHFNLWGVDDAWCLDKIKCSSNTTA